MHDGRFKTLEQVVFYNNMPFMFVVDSVNINSTFKTAIGACTAGDKRPGKFFKNLY